MPTQVSDGQFEAANRQVIWISSADPSDLSIRYAKAMFTSCMAIELRIVPPMPAANCLTDPLVERALDDFGVYTAIMMLNKPTIRL
jgi:hypothetical protein